VLTLMAPLVLAGCGKSDDEASALVKIQNDSTTGDELPAAWTICRSSYLGINFGTIGIGETSAEQPVTPGLDFVLMVAAWDDPSCVAATSLPIASTDEEEVVDGQSGPSRSTLPTTRVVPARGRRPIPEAQSTGSSSFG